MAGLESHLDPVLEVEEAVVGGPSDRDRSGRRVVPAPDLAIAREVVPVDASSRDCQLAGVGGADS